MNKAPLLLAAALVTALPLPVHCAPSHDRLRLCGRDFVLVQRINDPSSGSVVSEYAPKGATSSNWDRLVTIHERPPSESPSSYIQNLSAAYARQNPGVKFSSGSSSQTGDHWMDAIFVSPPGSPGPTANTVEWSFFRASPAPSGTRVLQYSERRRYSKSPEEVFSRWDLSLLRERVLPLLLSEKLPLPRPRP